MVQMKMTAALIAPCGMNCAICSGHLRDRNPCGGCSGSTENKPGACRQCTVTVCEQRRESTSGFCYECEDYPCRRIKQLDARYRAKYTMSMMENLAMIREQGMDAFLKREEEKWTCPECGGIISCHNGVCYTCLKNKPKPARKRIPADAVTDEDLVAPCGMNCGICTAYLVKKYDLRSRGLRMMSCGGCLPRGKGCAPMKTGCEKLVNLEVRFCYECGDYADCQKLNRLDDGYRDRYHMSMRDNLDFIKEHGMTRFLEKEKEKWTCPDCGGTISCHNGICYSCGADELKARKHRYSWE